MPTLLEFNMATGTPSRASAPLFHADNVEQAGEYRTLSVLAITSLIFGLASPLCFAGPLLLAIPLFGIAVSILALRRIATNSSVLAGRWAAICGLLLCVAFTVAPISRHLMIRYLRVQQAKDFGRAWITMVLVGHADHAFQLSLEGTRGTPTPEPGAPPLKTSPYEEFLGKPTVKALAAAGADSDVRFTGTLSYQPESSRVMTLRQQFEVTPQAAETNANSDGKPIRVILNMQRAKLPTEGRLRWLVTSIEAATPSAGAGTSQ